MLLNLILLLLKFLFHRNIFSLLVVHQLLHLSPSKSAAHAIGVAVSSVSRLSSLVSLLTASLILTHLLTRIAGTKYSNAGCAELNLIMKTNVVASPTKYPINVA